MITQTIKVDGKEIQVIVLPLQSKNLIILRGANGYVMCGYLDMSVADKFNDVAIKVTGVSGIDDVLNAKVNSCSSAAAKLGIAAGQPIKEVLKIIA
jgi:uncharacterized protein YunC (DUF1805 family)